MIKWWRTMIIMRFLPFYLNQRVFAVNVGGELSFGMQHQDTDAWMLKDANFCLFGIVLDTFTW